MSWPELAALGMLAYFVLLGGTDFGALDPFLRTLNAVLAGVLLARYVIRLPEYGDTWDRWLLLAVLLFAVAGVLSSAPRQSFDAVLGAATYAAALFTARDLARNGSLRRALLFVLMGLSAILTVLTAAAWSPTVATWISATHGTIPPPLNFELSAAAWGHRYDLALLLVILYPAWWVGSGSPVRRALAITIGTLDGMLVILAGSRSLWLALLLGTIAVALPGGRAAWRRMPWLRTAVPLTAVVVVVLALISGLGGSLLHRGLSSATLGWRAAMWGPLVQIWFSHPIAGYGPGSFQWILQQTAYFDTNTWAPRHPDSAVVQIVAEGGLLGLAALAITASVALVTSFRGRFVSARWVAAVFAVSSLAANPTVFPFLIVVAIAWMAFATPHSDVPVTAQSPRWRPVRVATLACSSVIVLAVASMTIAAWAYESARAAVGSGDYRTAEGALNSAIALDPSMALYRRERGELALFDSRPAAAVADLAQATTTNPSDDLAWRALGMAYSAVGDTTAAEQALEEALATRRADVVNLIYVAQWMDANGDETGGTELLAEAVQSWPTIVAAPAWDGVLPPGITTAQIVDRATQRWALGMSTPAPPTDQGLWLAAMSGRSNLDQRAIDSAAMSSALAETELDLLRCSDLGAGRLDEATRSDVSSANYWTLRILASSLAGRPDDDATLAARALSGHGYDPADESVTLNPLNESGEFSTDAWGYRRRSINWPLAGPVLPDPGSGLLRWLLHPRVAVQAAGLTAELPACR